MIETDKNPFVAIRTPQRGLKGMNIGAASLPRPRFRNRRFLGHAARLRNPPPPVNRDKSFGPQLAAPGRASRLRGRNGASRVTCERMFYLFPFGVIRQPHYVAGLLGAEIDLPGNDKGVFLAQVAVSFHQ